jgi:DNA-binding IclR family transcriptional regulator
MALKETGRKVKSVQTALRIVEHLQEHDGATLTDICEHFDFARSTAHSYLSTLESMEYVTKEGDEYRISLKFLSHGIAAKNSVPVSKVAKPTLERVAAETDIVAWLVVEEHGHAVYLDNEMADDAVRTFGRKSKRTHLHTIAGGKAILSYMDEPDRRAIIDNYGLPAMTEHTMTDREELLDELQSVRESGYAISEHEAALGVASVAAPIIHEEAVLGAVQLSSLASRLEEGAMDEDLSMAAVDAAEEIAARYDEVSE